MRRFFDSSLPAPATESATLRETPTVASGNSNRSQSLDGLLVAPQAALAKLASKVEQLCASRQLID